MKLISQNKKARYNFSILSTFNAGIVLQGTEIKSIRNNGISINEGYCKVINNEIFLVNAHIKLYEFGNRFNHDETRIRKLLLTKREIKKINDKIKLERLVLVPLKAYFSNSYVKIEIGLGKPKTKSDKREVLKKREFERNIKNRY